MIVYKLFDAKIKKQKTHIYNIIYINIKEKCANYSDLEIFGGVILQEPVYVPLWKKI